MLRDAQGRLRDLAGERVEQRLASILLMLSANRGKVIIHDEEKLRLLSEGHPRV